MIFEDSGSWFPHRGDLNARDRHRLTPRGLVDDPAKLDRMSKKELRQQVNLRDIELQRTYSKIDSSDQASRTRIEHGLHRDSPNCIASF